MHFKNSFNFASGYFVDVCVRARHCVRLFKWNSEAWRKETIESLELYKPVVLKLFSTTPPLSNCPLFQAPHPDNKQVV